MNEDIIGKLRLPAEQRGRAVHIARSEFNIAENWYKQEHPLRVKQPIAVRPEGGVFMKSDSVLQIQNDKNVFSELLLIRRFSSSLRQKSSKKFFTYKWKISDKIQIADKPLRDKDEHVLSLATKVTWAVNATKVKDKVLSLN